MKMHDSVVITPSELRTVMIGLFDKTGKFRQ